MIEVFLTFIAGILTIAAPCILLPLPIIFGASVGHNIRTRPLFITLGFVITFSILGLSLNFIVRNLNANPEILRHSAAILLCIFGLLMIWPQFFERFSIKLSGLLNKAGEVSSRVSNGNFGGFLIGVIIGIIWAPCAGPILGSILTLIAKQAEIARASVLLLAYAVGAGIPMLVIAYGGQTLTTKVKKIAQYAKQLQRFFGFIIILLAFAVYFQYDTVIQAKILDYIDRFSGMPERIVNMEVTTGQDMSNKLVLDDYGVAPELTGINHWLNSKPLTIESLRGKVVLVDFWTYSCINCLRTLPHITEWHEKYKDKGLVIIGVHTPEFAFEKNTTNVEKALQQFNITYPVAQDNDYATWNAYNNHYWPAKYIIDQSGTIVYTHFGEGNYEETETVIRQLLDMGPATTTVVPATIQGTVKSPEIYFGLSRLQNLTKEQTAYQIPTVYTLPAKLDVNKFAFEGTWEFKDDRALLQSQTGKIALHFSAGKVFW